MPKSPHTRPRDNTQSFLFLLGSCLNNWQNVENELFRIFVQLLFTHHVGIASILFSHIRAFDQRLVLIDKLAKHTLPAGPVLDEWVTLQKRLSAAGDQRHRIVHYQITSDKDHNWERKIEPPVYDFSRRVGTRAISPKDEKHYIGESALAKIMNEFALLPIALRSFADRVDEISPIIQKALEQDNLTLMARLASTLKPQE